MQRSLSFLAGGGINISHANKVFQEVVEKTGVPVVTTIMGRGAIPTNHPLFIGNLGMHGAYAANMAVSNCDVLFSIGTRFTTESQESFMNLPLMPRLSILTLTRPLFPETSR